MSDLPEWTPDEWEAEEWTPNESNINLPQKNRSFISDLFSSPKEIYQALKNLPSDLFEGGKTIATSPIQSTEDLVTGLMRGGRGIANEFLMPQDKQLNPTKWEESVSQRPEHGHQVLQSLGSYLPAATGGIPAQMLKLALLSMGMKQNPFTAMGLGLAPKVGGKALEKASNIEFEGLQLPDITPSGITAKMFKSPLSQSELKESSRIADDTNVPLGRVIQNPALNTTFESVSSVAPFAGGSKILSDIGQQVKRAGKKATEEVKPKERSGDLNEITQSLLNEAYEQQNKEVANVFKERDKTVKEENVPLRVPDFRREVKRYAKSIKNSPLLRNDPRFASQLKKFNEYAKSIEEKRVGTTIFGKEETPIDTEIPIRDERIIDTEGYVENVPKLDGTEKLSGNLDVNKLPSKALAEFKSSGKIPESFIKDLQQLPSNAIERYKATGKLPSKFLEKWGEKGLQESYPSYDILDEDIPISQNKTQKTAEPYEAESASDRYVPIKKVYSYKGEKPSFTEAQVFRNELYRKAKEFKKSTSPADRMIGNNLEEIAKALGKDINRSISSGSKKLQEIHKAANEKYQTSKLPFLDPDVFPKLMKSNPEKIVNEIIKPGKTNDQYQLIEKTKNLLPKDQQTILGYTYLKSRATNRKGEIVPGKLDSALNNLGNRQFDALFTTDQKMNLTDFQKLKEMGQKGVDVMNIPKTGWGGKELTYVMGATNALIASPNVATAVGLSVPIIGAKVLNKMLTSKDFRTKVVNKLIENEKSKTTPRIEGRLSKYFIPALESAQSNQSKQ